MEQGSHDWYKARLGKITGSEMSRVMGGPRAWVSYAKQLREELVTLERLAAGETIDLVPDLDVPAMAWGRKWEPIALAEYSFREDVDVDVVGFAVHPDFPFIGCSLDGRVRRGLDHNGLNSLYGVVEIKCPYSESMHLHTLSCGVVPGEHVQQLQTGIWVYHVDGGAFVSFDPRRDLDRKYFHKWVDRDGIYISLMEARCLEFWEFVQSNKTEPGKIKSAQIGQDTIPQLF